MTKYIAKRFNKGNQSEVGGIRTGYYAVVEPKEVKTMNNYWWEILFPDVSFRDKICVVYADGTEEIYKHLYMNSFVLKEINWENVIDCFEV